VISETANYLSYSTQLSKAHSFGHFFQLDIVHPQRDKLKFALQYSLHSKLFCKEITFTSNYPYTAYPSASKTLSITALYYSCAAKSKVLEGSHLGRQPAPNHSARMPLNDNSSFTAIYSLPYYRKSDEPQH
jgi:hypothetical protein